MLRGGLSSAQGGKRITAKNSKTKEEVICDLSSADIFPANPADQFAPDHCALIHLNEPCVLENSRGRVGLPQKPTTLGPAAAARPPTSAEAAHRRPDLAPGPLPRYVPLAFASPDVPPATAAAPPHLATSATAQPRAHPARPARAGGT